MSKNLFRIYRNLHKQCYSISYNGIVVMHTTRVIADNATLYVSEAGRQRVLATGHKNVHAYVQAANIIVDTIATTILPAMLRQVVKYPEMLERVTFNHGVSAKPLGVCAAPSGGFAHKIHGWITYNPRKCGTWVTCYTSDPLPADATYAVDLSWSVSRPALFAVQKVSQEEFLSK